MREPKPPPAPPSLIAYFPLILYNSLFLHPNAQAEFSQCRLHPTYFLGQGQLGPQYSHPAASGVEAMTYKWELCSRKGLAASYLHSLAFSLYNIELEMIGTVGSLIISERLCSPDWRLGERKLHLLAMFMQSGASGFPSVAQQVKNLVLSLRQHGFNPWPGPVGYGSGIATAMAKLAAAAQIWSLAGELPYAWVWPKEKKEVELPFCFGFVHGERGHGSNVIPPTILTNI